MGICHHPHPTRCGAEVLGFLAFTSHSRIRSQVHFSLHQHMRRGEATWEGTGGVGEAVSRWAQTPQEQAMPQAEAWRAWKPILTFCSRDGERLEQALDLFLLCRSSGRSRLRLSRDRAPQGHPITGTGHHSVTPTQGQVHGKEGQSRRALMLGW